MTFTYQLSYLQELNYPAFLQKPALTNEAKHLVLDRHKINQAVEQLNAGSNIDVIANDDPVAISLLVHELTFQATKVFTNTSTPPRTIPGHLFVLFHGESIPHKIW
ncbi:hypothetical protein [Spirosoma aerophilum]